MQAKNVLYAAVGAPVVAARKVTDAVGDLKTKINEETSDYTKSANKAFETWASEGEKVVARVSDNKTVEEIAAKVDLDQVQEQVGKLRTQLEDMLATWRSSFRPEKDSAGTTKPAAKTTAAKSTAKKPAAKSTAKTPAAKSTAKKPAAKKPAAKNAAAKASTAKAADAS
jgi:hypothetical protein